MNKKIKYILLTTSYIVLILFILFLIFIAFDTRHKTVIYNIENSKINNEITIGFISDLHTSYYGKDYNNLISTINKSKPDVLLLGGDIIDDEIPEKRILPFLKWAGENYQTYYVTGNHEYYLREADRLKGLVRSYGIVVLEGETKKLELKENVIDLSGINDADDFYGTWKMELDKAQKERSSGVFSILLTHRPEHINYYLKFNYDLILSGHTHGGQWRIPYILNGFIAPNQGLFPKYGGGLYDFDNSTMIISRGLSRESTRVPRIFNRPEYVVIKINK